MAVGPSTVEQHGTPAMADAREVPARICEIGQGDYILHVQAIRLRRLILPP